MPKQSEQQTMTVLVVDDNPNNLSIFSEWLEEAGIETMNALDGKQALELVERSTPDLILMDVMMPHIDGFGTCQQLKSNADTREIPVIFITALSDPDSKLKCFNAGGVDYVSKPVQRDELLARVRTHLTISSLQRQFASQNIELQIRNETLNRFTHTAAQELFPPLSTVIETVKVLKTHLPTMTAKEINHHFEQIEQSTSKMVSVILNTLLNENML